MSHTTDPYYPICKIYNEMLLLRNGSVSVDINIIEARYWIVSFYWECRAAECMWIKPHITLDEDGSIVFEWWFQDRKITAYISYKEKIAIRVWGTNIIDQMVDCNIDTTEERYNLWEWLIGN